MADEFVYISETHLRYEDRLRHAYLGEVSEPVVYGQQGTLRQFYGVPDSTPVLASTLDHIVAAVGGWMYGTFAGALSARKVRFNRDTYEAHVEGKIEGSGGKTIRITEIAVHYKLAIPIGTREETERALRVHPQGCPAHESVKDAIRITWDADISEFEPPSE